MTTISGHRARAAAAQGVCVMAIGLLAGLPAAVRASDPSWSKPGRLVTAHNATLASPPARAPERSTMPSFDALKPSDFVAVVDHPYFPRVPGTQWVYQGKTEEGLRRTESEVLGETIEIMGIPATVVTNKDYLDGRLTEDNLDFYAQDKEGNVWYLGEEVANYEDGSLHDHAGSWLAGEDGAIAGIVMLARPAEHLGQSYRQEHLLGCTRDKAVVVSSSNRVAVPAGRFERVVQTHDTSDVETDLNEHKFYAQGIGLIKTIDLTTGAEFVLVKFSK